jgi:diguanylate cyclase (GGDEF)-like protein
VLYFYRRDRDDFQSDEIEVLMTFAHFSAGALDNAELHARTAALAATDALTGLFNRRVFDVRLAEEVQRTRRFGQFFSLLLLDIDHFKRINDRHGHMFGDQVLRRLADVLRAQMREVDVVARFGGEEFVVVLPGTDATGAQQMAERLRASIAATDFAFGEQAPVPVTVSVGTASFPEDAASGADLLAHADVALYQAKANGRNRVCRYRGPVAGGV